MKPGSRIGPLFSILILCAASPVHHAQPEQETEFRSMYIMRCGGLVTRLDIVSDRITENFVLDEKTRKEHLVPDTSQGQAYDGCLTYGAAYDRSRSIVFTVVPVEPQEQQGGRHFRVLGFHLPDFRVVEIVQIEPAFERADPAISFQHGQLRVAISNRAFSIPMGVARGMAKPVTLQPHSPEPGNPDFSSLLGNPPARDLERFAEVNKETGGKQLFTWMLETSGGTSLVRVLYGEENKEPLVIAAIQGRRAAVMRGLPQTLEQNVRLTPGGRYVYVEEALPPLDSTGSRKTGHVALFEAATGKMLRSWTIPGIQDKFFLAFTPTGKAIYDDSKNYTFEPVAPSFPDLPVEPMTSSLKWFFTDF